jgi:N-acetylmuramoyl-L-alanine amidase
MPDLPREHAHLLVSRPSRIAFSWPILLLLLAAGLLAAEQGEPHRVTAVRFWSLGDVTRVAIETDGEFQVRSDHLSNPERIFFDLSGTKPALGSKSMTVIPVSDKLVNQIRVAEPQHNVTRVVLDLAGAADASTTRLENPHRLIIELRQPGHPIEVESSAAKPAEHRQFNPPPAPATSRQSKPPQVEQLEPPPAMEATPSPGTAAMSAKLTSPVLRNSVTAPAAKPTAPAVITVPPVSTTSTSSAPLPSETALPAKRNESGDRSMIRVLGLKVGRIVLDPGHGGHDNGTVGPEGLREKDLVLDIAQRLGALIQQRMGSEVIYTRSDDTFIPLERRTEIANEAKADLFLSIHANSSPLRSAAGVETYYLNFTTSKAALEVAARENSGSEQTVYELQDLLQKIALKDKIEESREFASRIQTSLFALSAKSNSKAKDRGIKKAPFVVLIGASMPSVLAEVGFISNTRDESTMKRQEYRERIAEALYKGLSSYANTLSHFQVAQRE